MLKYKDGQINKQISIDHTIFFKFKQVHVLNLLNKFQASTLNALWT